MTSQDRGGGDPFSTPSSHVNSGDRTSTGSGRGRGHASLSSKNQKYNHFADLNRPSSVGIGRSNTIQQFAHLSHLQERARAIVHYEEEQKKVQRQFEEEQKRIQRQHNVMLSLLSRGDVLSNDLFPMQQTFGEQPSVPDATQFSTSRGRSNRKSSDQQYPGYPCETSAHSASKDVSLPHSIKTPPYESPQFAYQHSGQASTQVETKRDSCSSYPPPCPLKANAERETLRSSMNLSHQKKATSEEL